MDLDAYVTAHAGEWRRLEALVRRRRLAPAEVDELVALYQRAATQLSVVQTRSPDPALLARLSTLVARARSAVTGSPSAGWSEVTRFFTVTFPVAVYRAGRWCIATGLGFLLVAFGLMGYLATRPRARFELIAPDQARQLCATEFAGYYSSAPAGSFAANVWTNNALVSAGALVLGIVLLPTLFLLLSNAVNLGVVGGFMLGCGQAGEFFGLISPHGILELTAVFVAAGVGLRLGWSWIEPGARPRSRALAEEGRSAVTVALGLVVVLAVSGAIEAFVTPSPLPTWARVGIGVAAEAVFLSYVVAFGRSAARRGETGDLTVGRREDVAPTAAG